jgi:NAD(P)-dependent dehydrogenase (short-subunit alcohol dehydrogenase family)
MVMFDGKVAIVTGAARGLGRDYAEFLAKDGAAVVLADVNGDGAEQAAKEIEQKGARAIGLNVDVTDEASVNAMVTTAVTELGGIDFLVNNAAIWGDLQNTFQGVLDNDPAYWRTVIDVNLTGVFLCTRAVVPAMRTRGGGRIVNITSIGAWMVGGPYGVSKLAVNQLTYATAAQLGPDRITVNAVAPGMIYNDATKRQVPKEMFDAMIEQTVPVKRPGTSQDMYSAIRWLCSDDAGFVTGQVISPNGGSHARF